MIIILLKPTRDNTTTTTVRPSRARPELPPSAKVHTLSPVTMTRGTAPPSIIRPQSRQGGLEVQKTHKVTSCVFQEGGEGLGRSVFVFLESRLLTGNIKATKCIELFKVLTDFRKVAESTRLIELRRFGTFLPHIVQYYSLENLRLSKM